MCRPLPCGPLPLPSTGDAANLMGSAGGDSRTGGAATTYNTETATTMVGEAGETADKFPNMPGPGESFLSVSCVVCLLGQGLCELGAVGSSRGSSPYMTFVSCVRCAAAHDQAQPTGVCGGRQAEAEQCSSNEWRERPSGPKHNLHKDCSF